MEWRIATWADVESVLDRLSDQHRAEYERVGFPGETFNLRLLHFMLAGETHCLWFDDKPQAFLSIANQNGVVTTWLGVTNEAFARGAGPIKMGRKRLREAADKYGPIISFITSKHPAVTRWMELFGFRLADTTDTAKVFVFA